MTSLVLFRPVQAPGRVVQCNVLTGAPDDAPTIPAVPPDEREMPRLYMP